MRRAPDHRSRLPRRAPNTAASAFRSCKAWALAATSGVSIKESWMPACWAVISCLSALKNFFPASLKGMVAMRRAAWVSRSALSLPTIEAVPRRCSRHLSRRARPEPHRDAVQQAEGVSTQGSGTNNSSYTPPQLVGSPERKPWLPTGNWRAGLNYLIASDTRRGGVSAPPNLDAR